MTAGQLLILGMQLTPTCARIKARLGVVPQEDNLDEDLSVLQNLLVYARYFDMPSHWPASALRRNWSSGNCGSAATAAFASCPVG